MFAAWAEARLLPANATWNWMACRGPAKPKLPLVFVARRRFREEPRWRVTGEAWAKPRLIVHKLSDMQTDALKAALRDLGDARKLLDPTSRI